MYSYTQFINNRVLKINKDILPHKELTRYSQIHGTWSLCILSKSCELT